MGKKYGKTSKKLILFYLNFYPLIYYIKLNIISINVKLIFINYLIIINVNKKHKKTNNVL